MAKTIEIVGVSYTSIGMSFDTNMFSVSGFQVDAQGVNQQQFTVTTKLTDAQRTELDTFLNEIMTPYLTEEGII